MTSFLGKIKPANNMRIETTLKHDAYADWGAFSGLRDLLSNARDAQVQLGAAMSVRYRKNAHTLVIENEGTTLAREAILLGHTTKTGRGDLIGRFGEGMKAGILALVRAQTGIKIRTGSEVWVPKIERSERFDSNVLVFYVNTGREFKNRIQFEIEGIDQESYDLLDQNFLWLAKLKDRDKVDTVEGTLLLDEKFRGRIFVKGVFVKKNDSNFGYDLLTAQIDRDRKMLDEHDLKYRMQSIWGEALRTRPDLIAGFIDALHARADDLAGVNQFTAPYLPQSAKDAVRDDFERRYGAGAIPVATLAQSAEVEHLGRRGIICNDSLRYVLEQTLGTVEDNKRKLANEAVRNYGWHELTSDERASLQRAIRLVGEVETDLTLDCVDIVDFRDPVIQGMYGNGRVMIAHKMLASEADTLRILVHEAAHRAGGGDGEKSHVANVERIWSGIVERMRGSA
jgi:hypothetical protein